jgi:hypothetical protein
LQRDRDINNEINADRGQLKGHYDQLKLEDDIVRFQEQVDSAMHGGHITKGEQKQLNQEENQMDKQITNDK